MRRGFSLIYLLLALFLVFPCHASPAGEPVRIMPLGDSITQADKGHASYRYPLWTMLRERGCNVDFVGSLSANYGGENPEKGFDQDHEGHWGWRADQVINGVPGQGKLSLWLTRSKPDIVLVHLGSNDIFRGEPVETILSELKEIIRTVRASGPDTVVLIARLIPVADDQTNRRIKMLNDAISRLPAELGQSSKLVVVDQYNGFDAASDTYDRVHPNIGGEKKMAEKWFGALERFLQCGKATEAH